MALTQRCQYDGKHSGQISFPGGKVEETDKDIYHTALRETNEEIGVIMQDIEVIGQLTNVFIPVSNFLVFPIVGFINYLPQFNIDNNEVEELIELKLTDLINTRELVQNEVKLANNTKLCSLPMCCMSNLLDITCRLDSYRKHDLICKNPL